MTTSRKFVDGKPAKQAAPEPEKDSRRLHGCGEEGRNLRTSFIGGAALVVDRGVARRISPEDAERLIDMVGAMGEASA